MINFIINKRMTKHEKEDTLRMLDGNISRICVSDDKNEIIKQLGCAMRNLTNLALNNSFGIDEEQTEGQLKKELEIQKKALERFMMCNGCSGFHKCWEVDGKMAEDCPGWNIEDKKDNYKILLNAVRSEEENGR